MALAGGGWGGRGGELTLLHLTSPRTLRCAGQAVAAVEVGLQQCRGSKSALRRLLSELRERDPAIQFARARMAKRESWEARQRQKRYAQQQQQQQPAGGGGGAAAAAAAAAAAGGVGRQRRGSSSTVGSQSTVPDTVVASDPCESVGCAAAFPSWNRSILTEIYLCHACSCHEILSGNAAAGAHPRPTTRWIRWTVRCWSWGGCSLPSAAAAVARVRRASSRAAAAAVSRCFLACNGSPCLRHCDHGASIGGGGGGSVRSFPGYASSMGGESIGAFSDLSESVNEDVDESEPGRCVGDEAEELYHLRGGIIGAAAGIILRGLRFDLLRVCELVRLIV
jgi:hypothetical protein